MRQNDSREIKKVLSQYKLVPNDVEKRNSVLKVRTSQGNFALKKLQTHEDASHFMWVANQLRTLPVQTPPLLHTVRGERIVHTDEGSYYLTPWLENVDFSREKQTERLWDAAAWLHRTSAEDLRTNKNELERAVQVVSKRWDEAQYWMELFALKAEHQVYPSPFEQRFLTLFHEISNATESAKRKLSGWQETVHESDPVRLVLCHGKLATDHLLCSPHTSCLINFEAATRDTPCLDLVALFDRATFENGNWQKALNVYEMTFPLRSSEKQLLAAYLTYPGSLYKVVAKYSQTETDRNELSFIQELESVDQKQRQRGPLISELEKVQEETADKKKDETP